MPHRKKPRPLARRGVLKVIAGTEKSDNLYCSTNRSDAFDLRIISLRKRFRAGQWWSVDVSEHNRLIGIRRPRYRVSDPKATDWVRLNKLAKAFGLGPVLRPQPSSSSLTGIAAVMRALHVEGTAW